MRVSLRAKLALVALTLLVLPVVGVLFVNEMERVLLEGQERTLVATARAVATALHDRPQLLEARPAVEEDTAERLRREAEVELQALVDGKSANDTAAPLRLTDEATARGGRQEIEAILRGIERSASRVWVVNRRYQVLALAGSLKRGKTVSQSGWRDALSGTIGWLIRRPTEDFAASLPDDVLATGREITSALQGAPGTRARPTPDGRAVVLSAAHPVWAGDKVIGAVVVEETTNPVLSLRSAALERLLLLTLAAFAAVAGALIVFATRLSMRIRRLRDEAESALDARGRVARLAAGSTAGDELGDLSRSFSTMLERLAQHHAYLESLAGRLSHELRTPIAVVRSSLENLKLASDPEESRRYLERAEEGIARLNVILQRMTEATRLEQSLRTDERERYDLAEVVRGSVEGYRLAWPGRSFTLDAPVRPVAVLGSPDLAAQMLDKLIDNAVGFSPPDAPVAVSLETSSAQALLSVSNAGPTLPAELKGRLFDAMVSSRPGTSSGTPHLGLGLYVTRLIAEFHGGAVEAADLPDGSGACFRVRLPLAEQRAA